MPRYKRNAQIRLRPSSAAYTLFDSFSVDVAAGSVNGTYSDKSHSLRTVVDTNSKISIAGGLLDFATGAAANDGLWSPVEARRMGTVFHAKVTPSNTDGIINVGWDANTSGAILDCLQFAASGVLQIIANGGTAYVVGAYTATAYEVNAIMRAAGVYWYIKGGAFTYHTLLGITSLGTAAAYPAITAGSATSVFTANPNMTGPKRIYVPEPIAYDAFTRGDAPLGVSDSVGPDGQSCVSRAWSFPAGTWAVSSNHAVGTPTAGAEAVTNGNMETGDPPTGYWVADAALTTGTAHAGLQGGLLTATANAFAIMGQDIVVATGQWVTASAWAKKGTMVGVGMLLISGAWGTLTTCADISSVGFSQTFGTARSIDGEIKVYLQGKSTAIGEACTIDDVSLKPLTLASLFSSLSDARTADVKIRVKVATLIAGTQAGAVARLDDPANPANFIIAYNSGAGTIIVDECVAGVYTNLIPAVAKAFTADDELELDVCGDAVKVFHITDAGATTLIGSNDAATPNTNTNHGAFSTYVGNSFTSVLVEPKGTNDNAWAALDSL